MTQPVTFTFGLHLHQPVGNFDSVFQQHLDSVYTPLLESLIEGDCLPVTLHVSGPLIDWLEAHAPAFLDRVGRGVRDGAFELLLAGYDEPVLAVLPRADRIDQIARMRETLEHRFGARSSGLWLTERVWEPGLVGDLAAAGVTYVLVDDRHFLVSGFEPAQLHRHFRTEDGGAGVDVFPIDEQLRYLVPFRPPSEFATYLKQLAAANAPLAILADDAEKFGGWPGTYDWVYEQGWMREFLATLRTLRDQGIVRLASFGEALQSTRGGGLAYLPSASYREMEGWSLAPVAARHLAALELELGPDRVSGPAGALVRGGHWRNFFVKYPESNRMHKKMLALSTLSRQRGDPPLVRRAIARAQCNDAYWHGVFGGLYLPHLREAIWRELAAAEQGLRCEESLAAELADVDFDGEDEIVIHGPQFAAVVSPARGGAVEEWTIYGAGRNLADTLTRRREAYHGSSDDAGPGGPTPNGGADSGTPSIHDLDGVGPPADAPPFDWRDRAILQEAIYPTDTCEADIAEGIAEPAQRWGPATGRPAIVATPDRVCIDLHFEGLEKRLTFEVDGTLTAEFRWDAPESGWFTTELSLAADVALSGDHIHEWHYPIETVARSESGYDRTVQGNAVVAVWPAGAGTGRLEARVPNAGEAARS